MLVYQIILILNYIQLRVNIVPISMKIKEYQNKNILKGMNLDEIIEWCEENGYSSYRAKQIYQWMYKHGTIDSIEMKNISKDLREAIQRECILNTLKIENLSLRTIYFSIRELKAACVSFVLHPKYLKCGFSDSVKYEITGNPTYLKMRSIFGILSRLLRTKMLQDVFSH